MKQSASNAWDYMRGSNTSAEDRDWEDTKRRAYNIIHEDTSTSSTTENKGGIVQGAKDMWQSAKQAVTPSSSSKSNVKQDVKDKWYDTKAGATAAGEKMKDRVSESK